MSTGQRRPGPIRAAARRWIPFPIRAHAVRIAAGVLHDRAGRWFDSIPAPPLAKGAIDRPAHRSVIRGDVLHCQGWALREGRGPGSVDIHIDGILAGRARLGVGRADLAPCGAEALVCGFEFLAPLPEVAAGDTVEISALVRFDQGRHRHVLGPHLVTVLPRPVVSIAEWVRPSPAVPLRHQSSNGRPAVLAMTHQLDLGGGQLYLQDLLRGLQRTDRFQLSVVSPCDGPLREELEELGIAVHITAPVPWTNGVAYEERIAELIAWAGAREIDAVLANTVGAFAGIDLASRLGVPSIWAIHESFPVPVLWHAYFGEDGGHPHVRAAAARALREADWLVFEAEATRALYSAYAGRDRCLHVAYGIEIPALDTALDGLDRATARQRLRVPQDARLLVCVGTFEPRKSQLFLLRAFREITGRYPDARLALVGDNSTAYSEVVHDAVAATGLRDRVWLEPVGPDVLPWYRAADFLVSASDTESMPRSALEAMACGRPVLATDVYGVFELVEDGVTGWLVAQRDLDALVGGLERALATPPDALARMGRCAAGRVRRDHDASGYVDAYSTLLEQLIAAPSPRIALAR